MKRPDEETRDTATGKSAPVLSAIKDRGYRAPVNRMVKGSETHGADRRHPGERDPDRHDR